MLKEGACRSFYSRRHAATSGLTTANANWRARSSTKLLAIISKIIAYLPAVLSNDVQAGLLLVVWKALMR